MRGLFVDLLHPLVPKLQSHLSQNAETCIHTPINASRQALDIVADGDTAVPHARVLLRKKPLPHSLTIRRSSYPPNTPPELLG